MTNRIIRNPGLSPLVNDYFHAYEKVESFFSGNFREIAAFEAVAERVGSRDLSRNEITTILREQNTQYGCGQSTLQNIDRLNDQNTFAVVTGQQVGLFSGPLYTIYKTITVIKLAGMLNEQCEGDFVPVFWMASGDHDLEEIDHADIINSQNQVERIVCDLDVPNTKAPASTFRITPQISECIEKLRISTHESEFKKNILSTLSQVYSEKRSFVDAFASWMMHLFGKTGLVCIDATHPEFKSLGKEIFGLEIKEHSPSTDRVLDTSKRLAELDYPVQVQLHEGILDLFVGDQKRETVRIQDSDFLIGDSKSPISEQDLLSRLEKEPHHFSPNVLLRPLYQDALLPTVAYVGGPGEIAYFAQLKGVYEHFGLPMPVIYPRKNVTLLETRTANILDQYGLSVEEIWRKGSGVIHGVISGQIPQTASEMLDSIVERLREDLQSLQDELVRVELSLEKAVDQAQGKIEYQISFLEKKILQASKKRHETIRQQLIKTVNTLFPNRKPQERVLNITPFLFKYGESLIDRLFGAIDLDETDHQIVEL
jgi:bacillithiol biosynthesis cysteine-adding enzyme BshC